MMITLPRQRFRAAYSSNTSLIKNHEELRKSPRMRIFGERFDRGIVHTISTIGKPIVVKYDLERLSKEITRSSIENSRKPGFWRYSPLLPVTSEENMVSLGEVITPLIRLENLSMIFGFEAESVFIKDESRLPTGSFKARGLGMAVSMAKELGIRHLSIPTNGNAGSALAAYASRAGITTTVSLSGQYSRNQMLDTDSRCFYPHC